MSGYLRVVYGFCFGAGLLLIVVALQKWGAAEIRAEPEEVVFLTGAGLVWLFLATKLFAWLGLSVRDDVAERRNIAALVALCGAIIAAALLYAGGSIGEGPSFFNNVFSVGLAASVWFTLWILLELGAKLSRSIAEDRDFASGIRLACFLLSTALILSRAVAGDWHSEAATLSDFFADGWRAFILFGIALPIEQAVRPTRRCPFPSWRTHGLLPALLYLGFAIFDLWRLGAWEGMP